jgi:hypothetical protein
MSRVLRTLQSYFRWENYQAQTIMGGGHFRFKKMCTILLKRNSPNATNPNVSLFQDIIAVSYQASVCTCCRNLTNHQLNKRGSQFSITFSKPVTFQRGQFQNLWKKSSTGFPTEKPWFILCLNHNWLNVECSIGQCYMLMTEKIYSRWALFAIYLLYITFCNIIFSLEHYLIFKCVYWEHSLIPWCLYNCYNCYIFTASDKVRIGHLSCDSKEVLVRHR